MIFLKEETIFCNDLKNDVNSLILANKQQKVMVFIIKPMNQVGVIPITFFTIGNHYQ